MPLRILLIEDNPMDVALIQATLSRASGPAFALETADCLAAGLSRLAAGDIGLVLCDLSLPDSHGLETFSKVHAAARHLPIVILTGLADEHLAIRTVQEGAQEYLVKDQVDSRILVRAIRYGLERKRVEVALEAERDLFQTLQENVPDRIYFKDAQGRFLRVNRAWLDLFHLSTARDAIGKTDFDFFSEEHARRAFADELCILQTGKPVLGIVEKETFPDGRIAWVITSKLPMRDKQGRMVGTFGISRDITELKLTEEKLQSANAELLKFHEELKAAHLSLIEAEKMQSVGRLAAGVAHEVKNPLAILRMAADYLATAAATPEQAGVVMDMKTAIDRADAIVRGLLNFSAAHELRLEPVDIQQVIEESLLLVKHEMDRNPVTVVLGYEPKLPPVLIDPEKIKQVLINLLTNAIHAMPEGGTLKILSHVQQLGLHDIVHEAGSRQADRFRSGDTVVVTEVLDTGIGIPPDKLKNIFDPFFTTKPTGKGTGLGLAVVKKIVDMHGGTIDIQNAQEGGVKAIMKLKTAPGF